MGLAIASAGTISSVLALAKRVFSYEKNNKNNEELKNDFSFLKKDKNKAKKLLKL